MALLSSYNWIDSGEYDLESTGSQLDQERDAKSHKSHVDYRWARMIFGENDKHNLSWKMTNQFELHRMQLGEEKIIHINIINICIM